MLIYPGVSCHAIDLEKVIFYLNMWCLPGCASLGLPLALSLELIEYMSSKGLCMFAPAIDGMVDHKSPIMTSIRI